MLWHILDTALEAGILIVLILEFNYDKLQVERKHYKKRIKSIPKEVQLDKVMGEKT